jgi:hypothetical protein
MRILLIITFVFSFAFLRLQGQSAPEIGSITQPTCGIPTGSVVLNGLPGGEWTLTRSPDNVITNGSGTTTTVTGLPPGNSYTFTVTTTEGTSPASEAAIINPLPSPPPSPVASVTEQPSCDLATGTIVVTSPTGSEFEYNIDEGAYQSSATFTGIVPGDHNIRARSITDNTCVSDPSAVTVNTQPVTPSAPTAGAVTHPTCAEATGSVVLNDLPSTGTWTLNRTPGGSTTGSGSSITVTDLTPDTYSFTVTNEEGCTSVPLNNVVINPQPSAPAAASVSVVHPTCAVAAGSITITDPLGEYQYNIDGGTFQVSVLFSGLTPGPHTILVRRSTDNTCISAPAEVTINTQPSQPQAAIVSLTHPTCSVPTGTVLVTSPVGDYQYNIDGGNYQASTSFLNVLPGNHNITVRRSTDITCISAPTPAVIDPQPVTPAAPVLGSVTQPTCAFPTGSIVLNGLPPTGTWILTRTPGGTTTGSGSSITISGLSPNTYSFTVTNEEGCTSTPLNNVVINPQPSAPDAATVSVVHPTCAVAAGSITVTDPLGEYQYNIDGGTFQTSILFSGLPPGTHTILVRRSTDNTCISSPVVVTINTQPSAPQAATFTVTQPTCTIATGIIVITSPLGNYQYNIDGGTYQTSVTFSGVASGNHNVLVRSTIDNTCISDPTPARIDPQPVTPAAPVLGSITQPSCTVATGSVSLTGLPSPGTWTLTRTPGGSTTGTGASITITGLTANTYSFTVNNESGCTSSPLNNVVINSQPVTPAAPTVGTITQPSCAVSTGSVILNGLPASGTWILTRTPGGTIYTGSGTTTTITGLPSNTYTFTVTNAAGCTSSATNNIVINTQPPTPTAPLVGSITQPTCAVATGSIVLNGLPSAGTWTLTRAPGGDTYSGTGTSVTISGLPANIYTFTVTNSSGCTSVSSANAVINAQPPTPSVPSVGTITQPTCTLASGSVILTNLPSTGTWTLTRTPDGTTISGTGSTTIVTGLTANTYTFTVTNSYGCTSTPTENVTITPQPVTPSPPVIGTITHPDCSVSTGSVIISGLPSTGTWTLTRNPGSAATSSTGTSITLYGIPPGIYTYIVSNVSGCVSAASVNVVINASPITPSAPVAEMIIQPSCTVETGSVTLNGLPSTGTWTLNRNPGNISTTGTGTSITITGLTANTYTFTVTNESGCISPVSGNVIINPQPVTPLPPLIGTIIHPSCTSPTGSVILNGLPLSDEWIIIRTPGEIRYPGSGSSATIPGLTANTYRFTVTNESGCTSAPSENVTINTQPPTPVAPVTGTITHPTCTAATGTVVLSGLPASGTWTLTRNPGGNTYTGTGGTYTISGLEANRYTFTVTNSFGCISPSGSGVVINPRPPIPSAPAILSITQPTESLPTGRVVINGLPSSGTWILTRSPDGNTTTGTGTGTTISGLTPGIYTYTVTNSYGCISPPSTTIGIFTLSAIGPGEKLLRHNDTIKIESSEGGSFPIKIESNSEWMVSENSLWIKAEKEPNSSVIKVTYLENISVYEKTAPLSIKYSLNPELVLNIIQKGRISQIKESKLESAKIYPNPANSMIYVDLSGGRYNRIKIAITNKSGNLVFIKDYYGIDAGRIIELNISGFPYGQYFITVSDGSDHKTLTIIKQ